MKSGIASGDCVWLDGRSTMRNDSKDRDGLVDEGFIPCSGFTPLVQG